MCKFLHLKEFTERPARLQNELSGHAINPMNQAHLSWVPMRTLFQSFANQSVNWQEAAKLELGESLATALAEDKLTFHEVGLEGMSPEQNKSYLEKYAQFSHPAALEIVKWLKGEFNVTRELVLTQ